MLTTAQLVRFLGEVREGIENPLIRQLSSPESACFPTLHERNGNRQNSRGLTAFSQ